MHDLHLWDSYDRREVHDIFSPETQFTPGTRAWGMRGIVKIPEHSDDFVFFVTFGQSQGEHVFDESITADGVLTWQSQPSQSLANNTIRELINHDERIHSIHLFLRTKRDRPYTYFGPLGYLEHDESREQPVHFQWQILEWPLSDDLEEDIGLQVGPSTESPRGTVPTHTLELTAPPERSTGRTGRKTSDFRSRKQARYPDQDARNKELGTAGEKLVVAVEVENLRSTGRQDLADQVVHVARVEGDAAGYDVRSYSLEGEVRHIEVKTTRGPGSRAFFVSANEIEFSKQHPDTYHLYRLYDFDADRASARYYVARGTLAEEFALEPTEWRASIKPSGSSLPLQITFD